MQQLQRLNERRQFSAIVEAIVYGYPGLSKAVGLNPPQPRRPSTAGAPPPLFGQVGYSALVAIPELYSGKHLRDVIENLLTFLEAVRKPMYVLVG
jgi:hypothetical protein